MKYSFLLIGGPTASQKTELALHIANKIPAIIINADSMQFYKDFKILNNRPKDADFVNTENRLFGNIEMPDFPNLGWWNSIIKQEISNAISKKKLPIIVGGTGLYLGALEKQPSYVPQIKVSIKNEITELYHKYGLKYLFDELRLCDEFSYKTLNSKDTYRIIRALEVKKSTGKTLNFWKKKNENEKSKEKKNYYYIVITPDKQKLYSKIDCRFLKMIKCGALDEVRLFKQKKINKTHPIFKMIGLKYLINYLGNRISLDEAIFLSQRDTRRYAKRQITWFKNQPLVAHRFLFDEAIEFFGISTCKNYFLF